LIAVGAQAPPDLEETIRGPGVEFLGEVDDIREALGRYSVFLAPILSGSGVRVKLLEAFAAGIPVVSTRLGAEGLAERSGEIGELADAPEDFAAGVLTLLEDPAAAAALALRARQAVEQSWDINVITARLAEHYGQVIRRKRSDHS
jgi:glycosyltransferase involved in cell wall biosynthesis